MITPLSSLAANAHMYSHVATQAVFPADTADDIAAGSVLTLKNTENICCVQSADSRRHVSSPFFE